MTKLEQAIEKLPPELRRSLEPLIRLAYVQGILDTQAGYNNASKRVANIAEAEMARAKP
jgi:hypothetical protein